MALTDQQKATLKAAIAANTDTIPPGQPWTNSFAGIAVNAVPNTSDGNATIAGWYNQLATPTYWVWYVAPADDVFEAINWKNFTPADAVPAADTGNVYLNRALICQGKQFNVQTMLVGRGSINGKKQAIRTGLKDSLQNLPAGASGALLDAGWTAVRDVLSRAALRIEKVLVTGGSGTKADAGDMSREATITGGDVEAARNS